MEALSIDQIVNLKKERIIDISLNSIKRLSILNSDSIKPQLLALATNSGTTIHLNLIGIKFIDSTGFDCLNLVSRVAQRNHSSLKLINVEPELHELIEIVRQYSIFDTGIKTTLLNQSNVA